MLSENLWWNFFSKEVDTGMNQETNFSKVTDYLKKRQGKEFVVQPTFGLKR